MARKKEVTKDTPCEVLNIGGKQIDLFYIGTLAEALGRSSQTVRKWELGGILPRTIFIKKGTIRMYSREQIALIVACAEESKLKQGSSTKNFTKLLQIKMDKYNKKIATLANKNQG